MDDVFGSAEFRRDDFDVEAYLARQAEKLAQYEQAIKELDETISQLEAE